MGDISKNFSYKEFEVSSSYPYLIEKIPQHLKPNIKALVDAVLQPLRGCSGWTCIITSGYRGEKLNKAVGGVPTSQHTKGEACDTTWFNNGLKMSTYDVMKKAEEMGLEFDQMIGYPAFVHFSYSRTKHFSSSSKPRYLFRVF